MIESLEVRALLATFQVTNVNNSGAGSLRDAIAQANSSPGADEIQIFASGTISLSTGQLTISDSLVINNFSGGTTIIDAQQNSRIFDITSTAGNVTLSGLTLRNGRTSGNNSNATDTDESGGAIRSRSTGTLSIRQSTLSGNSTKGSFADGGAISMTDGPLVILNSTLVGNFTEGNSAEGGAIFSQNGSLTVVQSTLTGNSVQGSLARGGAIFTGTGTVTLSQSTLTLNGSVASQGGGVFSSSSPVTIRNSIVAGNTDTGAAPDVRKSTFSSDAFTVTHSLIGRNNGTDLTATVGSTPDTNGNFIGGNTDASKINPLLGALGSNGGLTQTHALLPGSLAIDRGSNANAVDVTNANAPLTADQRGTPYFRILDGDGIPNAVVDMGAFELINVAGPIVVDTPLDEVNGNLSSGDVSLREAIALANLSPGADTITFAATINTQPINMSLLDRMTISETLTITGNGAANTIIDGQQIGFGILGITSGDVTLNGLTIRNGRNSFFSGGAISSTSNGSLTINSSILSGNSTTRLGAYGGAVYARSGSITISQSTLSGNSSSSSSTDAIPARSSGGAIFAASGSITISQSTLSGNSSSSSSADSARSYGGAIFAASGSITISQSTLSGNSGTSTSTSTDNNPTTNVARSYGGAIFAASGSITISQSTLSGNSSSSSSTSYGSARSFGGAIHAQSGSITISQSTLSGNSSSSSRTGTGSARSYGGAIHAQSGSITISQSTLSGNSASSGIFGSRGGAIHGANLPSLTIRNSIVAGNTCVDSPDMHIPSVASVIVTNSLIGNSDGTGLTATVGSTPDANGNFIGGVTDEEKIDPLLGPLANNGGPTQTHALLTGSPAIDRGNNTLAVDVTQAGNPALTADQRGAPFIRTLDGDLLGTAVVDMGASEFSGLRVLFPSPNAFSLRPTFQWTPIAGATSYSIQINNLTTNVAQFHLGTTSTATYTPPVDLAMGRFRMWVKPNFPSGQGNWSAPSDFNILAPPTWTTMSRTQLTSRPTLTWNALPGAVRYDLWGDNFSTGVKQLIRQNVTGTSFTPTSDLPMGIYRFWIRGAYDNTSFGGWAVLQEFVVVPGPTPVGPLNATFNRTPTFSWNPVAGAVSYELYVRNTNTGAMVINGTSVTGTSFTPTTNLADGPYRWWTFAVSPVFGTGPTATAIKSGGSHPVELFVGGRTSITSPANSSSTADRTPTFLWRAVDGAVRYELLVNRINVPQAGIISQTTLTTTSFTPATDLPAGTYRAWVRAVSSTNEFSPYSVQVDFTVTDLQPGSMESDSDYLLAELLPSHFGDDDDSVAPKSEHSTRNSTVKMTPATRPDDVQDPSVFDQLALLDAVMAEQYVVSTDEFVVSFWRAAGRRPSEHSRTQPPPLSSSL